MVSPEPDGLVDERTLVLARSAAFGDGRHETTSMCLQAISAFAPRPPFSLLDVGSGSGILSIAAAKLGGRARGVDIQPAANAAARENARLSGVAARCTFDSEWPSGPFDVVVANILRDVLLELASDITSRLEPAGCLVLSGLVFSDVPEVIARYAPRLACRPEIFERDVWRTLVWQPRKFPRMR